MEIGSKNFPLEEESKSSMKEWILKTFKRRECIKFTPCKNYSEKCVCGRKSDDHVSQATTATIIKEDTCQPWKIQTHTALFQTNAFGTLEFQVADAFTSKAEYIRLSFDTKPQHIIQLLKSYWQLELPKLIISVHGGIANFTLQPKLKQAIERGLIKVPNTSKIWIITAGTDTGIVKHIGDVLRHNFSKSRNNIVVIGIVPWGVVNGRESLKGCGLELPYFSSRQLLSNGSSANLNDCHSCFLLVDDGTIGKYGCEISFRRRLERFLSRHKSEISMAFDLRPEKLDVNVEEKITLLNHHTIPLVCLVIEGGTNTIQSVLVNVQDKPPVPVVVCDGSGRAADLIAFTYKYSYAINDKIEMDVDLKEQLINTIMKTFSYNKHQAENIFVELMNCVRNKEYISIYKLGEDAQEIDVAILTASLRIAKLQLSKQLDLIMSWNRPDIAKNYILLVGNNAEKEILYDKMFDALSQDKVEFVKLFLEFGVNLEEFLTFKRLQDLYNCHKGPANTLLLVVKDVVKKMDQNYNISLTDIGLVIEKLMGGGYVSEYSKREFKYRYIRELKNRFNINKTLIITPDENENDSFTFKHPYNELLIWAVLMKRHKMAMFVSKRNEETLAKSLVATKLNKSLAREAELDDLDSEISDEFKKYAEEYATLAYGILERCYKEDDELTNQLLTYDLVNWSHWTCLNLAVAANLKEFLSHTACQMLLSDLWMGGMKIRKHVTYKVITALLIPPALFAIQFKSAKELQYMPQTQEEHEQELDDNSSISSESSNDDLDEFNLNSVNFYKNDNELNKNIDILKADEIIEINEKKYEQSKPFFRNHIKNKTTALETAFITQNDDQQFNIRNLYQQERKTINFEVKTQTNKLRYGKKIYEFYNAPITKFWFFVILYMIFLVSYTYMIIVKTPPTPTNVEIFVLIYIFTYGLDKIRELLQADSPRFSGKLKVFFSKILNTTDCIFILTTLISLPFRFSSDLRLRIIARLVYCVNSIYWYIKLLEFLIINKYAGPLIIIASRMLVDLFNFVIILLIVLMSFGVSRQAIKYPNEEFSWTSVKEIFKEPYTMLYGVWFADTTDPECDASALAKNEPQCQPGFWITPLTMTAYLIIAVFLLLTVLIASFNATFLRLNRISAQVWKFQRFNFVTSYEGKPLLAPPFVIIHHVYMVIKYFVRLCQRKKLKFDRKLKAFLSEEMIQRLHDFEEKIFYEYDHDIQVSQKEKIEEKVNVTTNRVENISTRIDDIFTKENMTKLTIYKVESRLQKLEEFNFEIQKLTNQLKQSTFELHKPIKIENDNDFSDNNIANQQDIHDSRLVLNSVNTPRPYLRRRMFSECNTHHKNQEFQNLQQYGSFKATSNLYESHKNIGKSLSKMDFQIKPILTIENLEDVNKNSTLKETNDNINQNGDVVTPLKKNLSYSKLNNSDKIDIVARLQSQPSTCIDQYTLHPFVYLQPVVKPPLNEYTSITDCIDTSEIDRAPSPPPSFLSSSHGAQKEYQTNLDVNDYCASESVRSAIARQESEMLRLAEESQHVIITQMLNKMSKVPKHKNKRQVSDEKNIDVEQEIDSAIDSICRNEIFNNDINDGKSIDIDDITGNDENEDNLGPLDNQNTNNNNKGPLLNENHRNSSQIWFVQSEADYLCFDEDENTNC